MLAAFDAEVRRSVRPDGSGARIEADPLVVRWVGADGRGWDLPPEVRLLPVTDEAGVALMADVHERVFRLKLRQPVGRGDARRHCRWPRR